MSDFIPDGYYVFNAAVDAVGKRLYPDKWDWQEPEAQASPPVEDYITGNFGYGDALRRLGALKEAAGPSDPALLSRALDWLHQRLFKGGKGRLKSYVLTDTGDLEPIPHAEWGSKKWDKAVSSGRIDFIIGVSPLGSGVIPIKVSGRVVFRTKDVKSALGKNKRRGPVKGTGSLEKADKPLIEKMHRLIINEDAKSVHDAANQVAGRAKGSGTIESRIKRLERRYRKHFENNPS